MEKWKPIEMKVYFIDGMIGTYWCDPDFRQEIIKHIFDKWQNEIVVVKWDGVFISDEIIKSYI